MNATALVNKLGDVLTGGTLTPGTKNTILGVRQQHDLFPAHADGHRHHHRPAGRAEPADDQRTRPGARHRAAHPRLARVRRSSNNPTPTCPCDPTNYSSLGRPTTRRTFIRQALCAAVGTAALTNTIRDLRFINAAMAQSSGITDYKALVCIFLNGGNDSNNLFIPTIAGEYANYATIRTPALAIPNTDGSGATALALNSLSSDGHTYGIHPACPELQALFNAGKMAPVFNVGTLVYPVTKAQYVANSCRCRRSFFRTRTSRCSGRLPSPTSRRRPAGAAVARTCSTPTTRTTATPPCSRCA